MQLHSFLFQYQRNSLRLGLQFYYIVSTCASEDVHTYVPPALCLGNLVLRQKNYLQVDNQLAIIFYLSNLIGLGGGGGGGTPAEVLEAWTAQDYVPYQQLCSNAQSDLCVCVCVCF